MIDPRVVAHLEQRGIRFCLIGAAALSARGYARYTADVDLLTVDRSVLAASFWEDFTPQPERRWGDASDPLQGVVRWNEEPHLDLVVGKDYAARLAVETAEGFGSHEVPVPTALALVLNKLEAGGHKDQNDVLELIAAQRLLGTIGWLSELPAHLPQLSPEAQALWKKLEPAVAKL